MRYRALAWCVLSLALASGRAQAQPPCDPVVALAGDAEVVEPTANVLRERGVKVGAQTDDCAAVSAGLERSKTGLLVTVTERGGRTVARVVAEVDAAATFIESWAAGGLVEPLLAARSAPPSVAYDDGEAPVVATTTATDPARGRPMSIGLAAQLGAGSDGSVWSGLRLGGCVGVGPVCLGGLVRLAVDTKTGGDSETFDTSRNMFDTMLTVELPIERGRFELVPGIGIGQSSVRVSRSQGSENNEEDTGGLRLSVNAALRYWLAGAWALRFDGDAGYAPTARAIISDSGDGEPDVDAALAGEPALQVWVGVGLEYGSR